MTIKSSALDILRRFGLELASSEELARLRLLEESCSAGTLSAEAIDAGMEIINTKTHMAVPREPTESETYCEGVTGSPELFAKNANYQ